MLSRFHAFDPTPRSLAWLSCQEIPDALHIHKYGLADRDGTITLSPPAHEGHVSYTVIKRVGSGPTVQVPVMRLSSILAELGHCRIDMLKLDIEGAEYTVIDDFLDQKIEIRQLCIEFHHRWPEIGVRKTKRAIAALREGGYRILDISDTGEEYTFVKT